MQTDLLVIGGGASGFFAALSAAENSSEKLKITLIEKSPRFLTKVLISGGGRCNLTHHEFDTRTFCSAYSRGMKWMPRIISAFGPMQTMEWFERHGVSLKTESDGRVFPKSDLSSDITGCLERECRRSGVETLHSCGALSVSQSGKFIQTVCTNGRTINSKAVIFAGGGFSTEAGLKIFSDLQIKTQSPVPSLFTFECADESLRALSGVSMKVKIEACSLRSEGILLLTHRGFSGPAVLKLSSLGARVMHENNYRFDLQTDWLPECSDEKLRDFLLTLRTQSKRNLLNELPEGLSARLWERHLAKEGLSVLRAAELSNAKLASLINRIKREKISISGRSVFKEEFVSAGGADLAEIDAGTMMVKKIPGLYITGEALDVDGLTGGYNLQAAWSTGYIAGKSAAALITKTPL